MNPDAIDTDYRITRHDPGINEVAGVDDVYIILQCLL